MGDFNSVLNFDERIGSAVRENEVMPIWKCFSHCDLDDVKFSGDFIHGIISKKEWIEFFLRSIE